MTDSIDEPQNALDRLRALVGLTAQLGGGTTTDGFDTVADFWDSVAPVSTAGMSGQGFSAVEYDRTLLLVKEAAEYTHLLRSRAAELARRMQGAAEQLGERAQAAHWEAERLQDVERATGARLRASMRQVDALTVRLQEAEKLNAEASELLGEASLVVRELAGRMSRR